MHKQEVIIRNRKIESKVFYEKNKERIKANAKKYREKNIEKIKKYENKRYFKNKEKINEYKKEWYLKNKEKILIKRKIHRKENKEKIKKYLDKNKLQINKRYNKYVKNRKKQDPAFKIKLLLRTRINTVLKRKTTIKSKKTISLLGCDSEVFKKYFGSLFFEGMTWEKFIIGEIHIDHILPCSAFELQHSEEQEICFHYTNLQPLWAKDNLSKGDKIL